MNRFDIFDAQVDWGGCTDRRPWLIVESPAHGRAGCFPISGQDYRGTAFPLPDGDADFAATGLKKSSFVHDDRIVPIAVDLLKKRRGRLEGDLLARFRAYCGI
jgi:hypothetical protein